MITEIPNTELKTGMQVMRPKPHGGFEYDYTLTKFFHTSPTPRFAHLVWKTSAGGTVVYARCGKTFVRVDDPRELHKIGRTGKEPQ